MENVRQIIKKHNNYVCRKKPKSAPSWDCRKTDDFPMNGNCLINKVICKCTVSPTTTTKNEHISDLPKESGNSDITTIRSLFINARHKNDTTLSSYLWELKKKTSEIAKLTWSILKIVPGYSNNSKRLLLCLHEKPYIATCHDQQELLHK